MFVSIVCGATESPDTDSGVIVFGLTDNGVTTRQWCHQILSDVTGLCGVTDSQ